jgi:hypothetical protein
MPVRVREVEPLAIRGAAGLPTDAELAILREEAYAGPDLEPDEVRTRQMLLCHDQYDRTCERFPLPYLEQFARTIPGKSLLGGHDTSQLPLGRFFQGGVVTRKEPFPVLQKAVAVESVPGFAVRETQVRYLQAGFYYPRQDVMGERLEAGIRTGVYRAVSIGFRYDDLLCDVCEKSYFSDCPHWIGEMTADGVLVTGTYTGDVSKVEALEGSIVFLGAQPGARILKGLALAGELDVREVGRTPWGLDAAQVKTGEVLARRYGSARTLWPAVQPARDAGGTGMSDEQKQQTQVDELRAKLETAAATAEAHTARIAALERDLETATSERDQARAELAAAQPWIQAGKDVLADLTERYLREARALGESEQQAQIVIEALTRKVDYAGLRELCEHQHRRLCDRFPDHPAGEPGRQEPAPAEPVRRIRERIIDPEIV